MENQEIHINLKVSDWNIVLNALAGRPFAEVNSLIAEIQNQASKKIQAIEETPFDNLTDQVDR